MIYNMMVAPSAVMIKAIPLTHKPDQSTPGIAMAEAAPLDVLPCGEVSVLAPGRASAGIAAVPVAEPMVEDRLLTA